MRREILRIKKWQRWAHDHPFHHETIQYADAADQQLAMLEAEVNRCDV